MILGALAVAFILLIIAAFSFRQPLGDLAQRIVHSGAQVIGGISAARPTNSAQINLLPISTQLRNLCDEMRGTKDPQACRKILERLRNLLYVLPPDVASREIRDFLATGQDADTHLDFSLQPGGQLGDASSVRVCLLDSLGQKDPQAAGQIAVQILSAYTTPDEWAVSLRNYAWAHPGADGRLFLGDKARRLLANANWSKNPTAGFLEAFDVVVYAHDTAATPALSTLLRDTSNPATGHAAFLAMDRLVLEEPVPMLQQIVTQPELMAGHEKTRADFVARADLAQPDQCTLVEKYLLDPTRGDDELSTFAAIFPNNNFMISNNLLSPTSTPTAANFALHDQEALAIVQQWQQDPRFVNRQTVLAQMEARLSNFVQQETGGSH